MVDQAGLSRFFSTVLGLPSFPIVCAYLLLIPLSKPWQKYTKPLQLRWVLIVYNMLCSILSMCTLIGFVRGLFLAERIYQKESTAALLPAFYFYWLTKQIELLDTVFMVLRHRRRQISFLHYYHHASMAVLADYARSLAAWPAVAVILAINSAVHVALYFYYGLTAYDPSKTPAWKRHLTEAQILQFFLDLVYAAIGYVYHGFCPYGFVYGFVMIGLFSNFYYHAYVKKRPTPSKSNGDAHQQMNGKID